MSFEKQYCFIAVCDGCGPACWEAETAPHYASKAEARRELAANYEWRIERELTGRFRMLCGRCADKQDCGKYGHDTYVPEVDPDAAAQQRWEQDHPFPIVMCRRCSEVLRDDAPSADHPDSMDHRLPPDLAELDRLTWPEGSEVNGRVVSLNPSDYTYRDES
jgi:hypothetical protein